MKNLIEILKTVCSSSCESVCTVTKHIPLCFNYPSKTDNLIQYAHTKAFPATIAEWTIGDLNKGYFQLFQINSGGQCR